ncbi:phosphoribosylglycinamide formyltransferase [Planococcus shenhongbingii]|uniref:phosphoribosylglycinamide formyltransferase 1 n=1 Tax=Planococcus shenhongbingii TaxID=3058398 RepID=A0ABT8NA89_9BACL|nr:formyltransferase family protein [Planococcus sp. N017]MDN7244594.1 formyltransferase family protein [Planococcus sp. N017]
MNFAFYVSGRASRLRKALAEDLPVFQDVKVIFSDEIETAYLEAEIVKKGIEFKLLDYKKILRNKNLVISNTLLETLKSHEIDYCFCFGRHLLKGDLLKEYENRIINFHPAILPLFPGINSIDQALEAKASVLGNTAHFIDEGMDTGPIILQNVVSVEVFKESGYDGVMDYQLVMLDKIYGWLKENRITVEDRKVLIQGSDYRSPAFFPSL